MFFWKKKNNAKDAINTEIKARIVTSKDAQKGAIFLLEN